jgi:hypothetical protein
MTSVCKTSGSQMKIGYFSLESKRDFKHGFKHCNVSHLNQSILDKCQLSSKFIKKILEQEEDCYCEIQEY